ncbi:MAG: hypothetical protein DI529_10465 [Chryseobacterium sp.]|nr:MAG: hypothetical protein DI529_10465 [Chryseobacterium sp.]
MKKEIINLNKWILSLFLIFPLLFSAQEGTKQISPDPTKLSGLDYNPTLLYGSYFNAPDDNEIHFTISDFNSERFYFGFSWTEYANTAGATTTLNYSTRNSFFYYRILDSGGNVMVGPTLMSRAATNAPGQILSYAEATNGPRIGTLNPAGYLPIQYTPTKNDTFTIEYWRGTSTTNSTMVNTESVSPFFDFTVASISPVTTPTSYTFKPGRVFATKWGLATTIPNASSQYATNINAVGSPGFYVYTDTNNVLKLEFPGFQPLRYLIGSNNYGVTDTNNFVSDRRSVNNGVNPPSLPGGFNVFLNAPDPNVFPYGVVQGGPPSFDASVVTPVNNCNTAPYYINFITQEYGDYRVIIKGTGYADRILYFYNLTPGNYSMQWDGNDGAGVAINPTTTLTFELTAFADRFNVPVFDVELNSGGTKVTTIAPVGMQVSNLFWDDSALTSFDTTSQDGNNTGAGTNNSTIGTASPAHTWNVGGEPNYYTFFGNARTINSWGYLYYQTFTATSNLLCADLTVTKAVNNSTPTIGSNVIFTINASNIVSGSTATSVAVTDVIPAGFTYVSSTPPSGTTVTGTPPNMTWNIGNLVNGTPRTLTITANVNADTHYTNIANISTVNYETNYNNNSAYVKVTPAAMPEFTATNICPTPDIDVTPPKGVQLNDLHFGSIPPGSTLVWFNNAAHTGSALTNTFITTSGSYYAFYYDSAGNCYSPASAKVNILIQDCKCRRSPTLGTPDGYTKVGISTQATKVDTWPENVANGHIALESTNKGFVITRTTTASITNPIKGMLIYDTTNNCFSLYNGTTWHCIAQTCNE